MYLKKCFVEHVDNPESPPAGHGLSWVRKPAAVPTSSFNISIPIIPPLKIPTYYLSTSRQPKVENTSDNKNSAAPTRAEGSPIW
ncbi:hypothetical protein HYALB_00004042 [Hymenoscyphus albidus]|uniref:Uncharacterized protein n=1 Tax=Hymenoscyphus albidus TaxID=595503 RepID=A0A9N9M320_9HELO|nr:hypothetical protein HYALB_00004042 [Hymenoscyphus albidus]